MASHINTNNKQYFTLISLANFQLHQLQLLGGQTLRSADPGVKLREDKLVISTVACLEAALSFLGQIAKDPQLQRLHCIQNISIEEIRVRFRLSQILFHFTQNSTQAEEHVRQAIPYLKPIELGMIQFYIKILINRNQFSFANSIIQDNLNESFELNAAESIYCLILTKVNLAVRQGDIHTTHSYLTKMINYARDRMHYPMMVLAFLYHIQIQFADGNLDQVRQSLERLDGFFSGPPNPDDPSSVTNPKLRLFYLIASIQYKITTGDQREAMKTLIRFHTEFETVLKTYHFEGNDFKLADVPRVLPSGETVLTNPILRMDWVSKRQLVMMGYLISAICQRNDTATDRAKLFLMEGLKAIDAELNQPTDIQQFGDRIDARMWLVNIKALVLVQLTDVLLIKSDYELAKETLIHAIELTSRHGCWRQFLVPICVSFAFYYHATNRLDWACRLYDGLLNMEISTDVRALILLNKCLILGSERGISDQLDADLQQLEKLCEDTAHSELRTAYGIFKSLDQTDSVQLKVQLSQLLKKSIQLNNAPLQSTLLLVLGNQFFYTEPAVSEKMLQLSVELSKQSHDHLMCLLGGSILLGLSKFTQDQATQENFIKVNGYHLSCLKTMQ